MEMKREDAVDVLFIAMPFCDEYMPCLTLALFKSVLARYVPSATVMTILPVKRFLARRLTAKRFLLLKITYAGCRESICRGKFLPAGSGRIPCSDWISFRKPMRWRKRT